MDQEQRAARAAEERKQKIRNLEYSLFGGEKNDNNVVGLPSIKPVDEYSIRYGQVLKENSFKVENTRVKPTTPQLFYGEPRKKVKENVTQSFVASDESGLESPLTDRSLLQSSSSSTVSSDVSPALSNNTINKSVRPKTTKRLDAILSQDLQTFGVLDSRLSTPSSHEEEVKSSKRRPNYQSNKFVKDLNLFDTNEDFENPLEVGLFQEKKGKVTILQNERSTTTPGPAEYKLAEPSKKTTSRIDDLLHQEQDDLALSLSHTKFLQLKNANLERVKAQAQAGEGYPDVGEMQQLEKMKTRLNLNDTESIDATSPDETFKDIPNDVFDKIPRAVTARIENRQKKKSKQKLQIEKKSLDLGSDYEPSTPSAPVDDDDATPRHVVSTRDKNLATIPSDSQHGGGGPPVGIIAMLFSGAPTVTRNGNYDQVEQDFMFALFLQKQEEEQNSSGSSQPRPRDPDVGHFCAPNTPGFCEANFCIIHSKEK